MQEFIAERNNGTTTTTAVDQALMKTFKDASAIDLAIQAGIVNEGEIISTIEDDKPHALPIDQLREMQEEIRELQEEQGSGVSDKISTTATSSNRCPAASEVTSEISSAISDEATARDTAIGNAISAEVTNRNDAISAAITTEVDNRNTAITNAISTEVSNRNTAITNAINGLDVSDTAEANKYVSAVSETNGRISVTRASLPTIATFTLSGTDLIITY